MPITLITGPANAGKARVLLEAVRAHVAHGEEPLLIVPTRADVEHYRRELATAGLVLGARVERFGELIDEATRRAGLFERTLSPLARERALAAVLTHASPGLGGERSSTPASASAPVSATAPASAPVPASAPAPASPPAPGFVRALAAFVAELEVERVTPGRLREALAAWAALDRGRTARAEQLSTLFEDYHALLGRIGRTDAERLAARAMNVLRRSPKLWGSTPVLFYGFDDLTRLQLDAIETLGVLVGVPVMVSLAYEPGRLAFAGRAGAFQTLLPLAAEHRELAPRAEHYAPVARGALHHLERSLFEPQQAPDRAGVDGAGAIRLLEGGSERAELELVAGEIRALLDQGVQPEEIALVHRSPRQTAELLAEVLGGCEIPFVLEDRRPFAHTAVGQALLGLLASACGGLGEQPPGELGDLLAWLRAPGLLERPELADRLEARARRSGVTSSARARALWEAEQWPLDTLDHLREAAERGSIALLERTMRELDWLFQTPWRQRAAILQGAALDEAHGVALAKRALGELLELARAESMLAPAPAELIAILGGLELPLAALPAAAAVRVLDPLALRARRVRALFLCGLQQGVFPASTRPEPLLAEEERRRLAEASGLRLGHHEDPLAVERYLLYATVSRPEQLLVLSWHTADDNGAPASPSLFLEDVCDLFEPALHATRRQRPLGAAAWPGPGQAPAWADARERALRGPRVAPQRREPLRDELLLAELDEQRLWSASSLENWAGCPVRWFVERLLRAEDLEPEPEPLARGALAHAALKDTLEGLRRESGSARLTPERLPAARRLLHGALDDHAQEFPLSVSAERLPGLRRRLEADLERYLEHAALQESPLEPTHMELSFGFPDEADGVAALELDSDVLLRGRVDRVDLDADGSAVVYDYKGARALDAGKWTAERNFQVALYMRVVEQRLGRPVAGGFYQPLAGRDLRARGLLDADATLDVQAVKVDRREHAEFESLLEVALEQARQAAREARAGALEARPESCAFQGGCRYPTICRCEP